MVFRTQNNTGRSGPSEYEYVFSTAAPLWPRTPLSSLFSAWPASFGCIIRNFSRKLRLIFRKVWARMMGKNISRRTPASYSSRLLYDVPLFVTILCPENPLRKENAKCPTENTLLWVILRPKNHTEIFLSMNIRSQVPQNCQKDTTAYLQGSLKPDHSCTNHSSVDKLETFSENIPQFDFLETRKSSIQIGPLDGALIQKNSTEKHRWSVALSIQQLEVNANCW